MFKVINMGTENIWSVLFLQ